MYYLNNDYTFKSEYNLRSSYAVNHIPEVISSTEIAGTILFGEDPGTIIEELTYADRITKLTR